MKPHGHFFTTYIGGKYIRHISKFFHAVQGLKRAWLKFPSTCTLLICKGYQKALIRPKICNLITIFALLFERIL